MNRFRNTLPVLCALGWIAAGATLAQVATVTSDEGRVFVDGDYVRIESPEGVTEVTGDWRSGGGAQVVTTDDLLVRLGAARDGDTLRLNLAGDVLFDFASAAITPAAEEVLGEVAQVIRDRALGQVLVVGHTDSRGEVAVNQRLSEERAVQVIRWLNRHEGIPAKMMVGRGMGERQPLAHETTPSGADDPAGRARNRRVELYLGTTPHADVRVAAGLVTVQSPEGEVRIREDRVDVGDLVKIDAGGVQVGGVSVSASGAVATGQGGGGQTTSCAAGRLCHADCPEGGCRMTCPAGATCDYSCRGGSCEMSCSAGANCEFGCSGGACQFSCAVASSCNTSCPSGDCR